MIEPIVDGDVTWVDHYAWVTLTVLALYWALRLGWRRYAYWRDFYSERDKRNWNCFAITCATFLLGGIENLDQMNPAGVRTVLAILACIAGIWVTHTAFDRHQFVVNLPDTPGRNEDG